MIARLCCIVLFSVYISIVEAIGLSVVFACESEGHRGGVDLGGFAIFGLLAAGNATAAIVSFCLFAPVLYFISANAGFEEKNTSQVSSALSVISFAFAGPWLALLLTPFRDQTAVVVQQCMICFLAGSLATLVVFLVVSGLKGLFSLGGAAVSQSHRQEPLIRTQV